MEVNSLEDIKSQSELKKIEQLQRIEKKLHRLSYMPIYAGILIIIYNFWSIWFLNNSLSSISNVFLVILVLSVCNSNVQRTDLLKQLFELKYDK